MVTSFNNCTILGESIELLLADEVDVIVVDNGSDDGSAEYLKAHNRITSIVNPENLGSSVARNQGIDRCPEEDVLLLDGDILYARGSYNFLATIKTELQVGCVGMNPDCCTADRERAWMLPPTDPELRDGWIAYSQYGLFSWDVLRSCRFDPAFGIGWGWEDNDMYMQMTSKGFAVKQVSWMYYHKRKSSVCSLARRGHSARYRERGAYFAQKWHPAVRTS